MRAGGEAVMARAFHASAAPSPPGASPLPSSGSWSPFSRGGGGRGGGGIGGLQWLLGKRGNRLRHGRTPLAAQLEEVEDGEEDVASYFVSTPYSCSSTPYSCSSTPSVGPSPARKRGEALARLRLAVLSVLARARRGGRGGARSRTVTGTIFGRLRGRAHLALQTDPRAAPTMMLELAAYSTGALVREMASGVVRLALECEKAPANTGDPVRCSCRVCFLFLTIYILSPEHPLTHGGAHRRREAAGGGAAAGGDDMARLLQRAQVRVRGEAGVRRRGVARASRRRAGFRRRRRAPGRRWRRRRGRHDVHEGQVREGGGIKGLGGALHG
ncbi:hypothetical protein ABZP36_012388 [Zizania latifolia]